eukprot:13654_1
MDLPTSTVEASVSKPKSKQYVTPCVIVRVIVALLIILLSIYIISEGIKETSSLYFEEHNTIFTQNNISVTCTQFNTMDADYCESALIKFPTSLSVEYNNPDPDANGHCSIPSNSKSSRTTHPTNKWRIIAQGSGSMMSVSCDFWCSIATSSSCMMWNPGDHSETTSDKIWNEFTSMDIPYYPISIIPNSWATSTGSTSNFPCYYIPSNNIYFENNPLCYNWGMSGTSQCQYDYLDDYGNFGFLTPIFKCSENIHPEGDTVHGSEINSDFKYRVQTEPELFYPACESCPKPIIISILGFFNETMITLVLVYYSSRKLSKKEETQEAESESTKRQNVFVELKIWWKYFAVARAVMAGFGDGYAIVRAVKLEGWLCYQCLVHIALNSSVFRVLFVQFGGNLNEYLMSDKKWTKKDKLYFMLPILPQILLGFFYYGIITCGSITHLIPFVFVYIWIGAIFMFLGFVLSKCCAPLFKKYEEMQSTVFVLCYSVILLIGISLFWGCFIWIFEIMIALYLGFPYTYSIFVPLDRSIGVWFGCSVYGTTIQTIVQFMIHIL